MDIDGRDLNLIYDYSKGFETYALRSVSISMKKGEFLGVSGPSGSGKSSLLYVLSGLKQPTSGTVYYDDTDIEAYKPYEKACFRKKKFGFIFQKHMLVEYMNVLDNVLVPLNDNGNTSRDNALELLDSLGLGRYANKKPYQLSGGQRQRVAVARALINKPSVVFADEPTASLDHGNAREVMSILENFKNTISLIVVTHDKTILKNADRIIEMWDGRVL